MKALYKTFKSKDKYPWESKKANNITKKGAELIALDDQPISRECKLLLSFWAFGSTGNLKHFVTAISFTTTYNNVWSSDAV